MRRSMLAIIVAVSLANVVTPAHADWERFWHGMKVDWHRMNCWPEPFNHVDRQATWAPFAVMINNGWRRQTTLGQYHFNTETHELNEAGLLKLQWILTRVPEERRMIFVQRHIRYEATADRIDSVQRFAARVVSRGPLPEVVQVDHPPAGTPADIINPVYDRYNRSIPEPRLAPFNADG